ncbi:MAG: UTP--glucose-1-phosphate uridylyltransferase GalU [Rhodospirillaceae bacterium]|nr:UTP--glucose-1-phosphate uridylyltransferase GalU [Rhodospirillaceae bacterium]
MGHRVRKAVFPVGGMGTRFLPATKAMPKEMLPVVDKPLIQYAVEEAAAAGVEHFIFVTGRGKNALEDHFDYAPELERLLEERHKDEALDAVRGFMPRSGQISYTRQTEPLGLGHAVWCARHLVGGEPFAVILPDDLILSDVPVLKQMADVYDGLGGGHLVAAQDVLLEHTQRYGILDVETDDGRLVKAKGLVEKPAPSEAPSTLSIIGRYILDPVVFSPLDRKMRGAGGEIQLTDALAVTLSVVPFHGLRFEGVRFDCGDKVGFLQANVAFALKRPDLADDVRVALRDLVC